MEGDIDPPSLPVADHEQDGYVMVDLTDIVSRCHVICIFLYYTYVLGSVLSCMCDLAQSLNSSKLPGMPLCCRVESHLKEPIF